MKKNATVSARIDEDVKNQAEDILAWNSSICGNKHSVSSDHCKKRHPLLYNTPAQSP